MLVAACANTCRLLINVMDTKEIFALFERQIVDYHRTDSVDAPTVNPFAEGTFEHLLWEKSYVDTVQWHLEDLIRPEDVDPVEALRLKRWIDRSNQRRTDIALHHIAATQRTVGTDISQAVGGFQPRQCGRHPRDRRHVNTGARGIIDEVEQISVVFQV